MNAHDAADKLRPDFHLTQMPPEDRHHIKFVEDVAAELGVDPTPFNLQQVAMALDAADIHGDDLHFPLMLFSRQHHAVEGIAASEYHARGDMTFVIVENEDQLKALGDGWVDSPADLPPRGDTPITAPDERADPSYHVTPVEDDEFQAEQARSAAADKAAADERAKLAAMQKSAAQPFRQTSNELT